LRAIDPASTKPFPAGSILKSNLLLFVRNLNPDSDKVIFAQSKSMMKTVMQG
jgi:hypothetical protein